MSVTGCYTILLSNMKIRELIEQGKSVERKMYGNVMAIMAILAGIFTLVNVNARQCKQV